MYMIENITKSYGKGENRVEVLKGVSLRIEQGERVAIIGPSGCGKSTLLNIMGTMDVCDTGRLVWKGEEITQKDRAERAGLRLRSFGFIFQAYHLISSLTVADNILVPVLARGETADYGEVEKLCARLGLQDRMWHYPHQLSGGEKQRTAIARAVIGEPDILFADEATGNLDESNSAMIMQMLRNLSEEKEISLVYVTHDLSLLSYADRVVRLSGGKVTDMPDGEKENFRGQRD